MPAHLHIRRNDVIRALRISLFFILIAAMFRGPAAADSGVYTVEQALAEHTDLSWLHAPSHPPRRIAGFSSRDPNGGRFNAGNFLRADGEEQVLVDIQGPGVLTRLWAAEPLGFLRFHFDGADEPQFEELWLNIADGLVEPVHAPFLRTDGGGCLLTFPMPFSEGLRITLTGQTWGEWAAECAIFPPEIEVVSWWPGEELPETAEAHIEQASDLLKAPADFVPQGEVVFSRRTVLHETTEPIVYTAETDVLITEMRVSSLDDEAFPPGLMFSLESGSASVSAVPWRELCGAWDATGEAANMLAGRRGIHSWLRIPFLLRAGERIELRMEPGGEEFPGQFQLRGIPAAEMAGDGALPRLVVGESLSGSGRLLLVSLKIPARHRNLQANVHVYTDEAAVIEYPSISAFPGIGADMESRLAAAPWSHLAAWPERHGPIAGARVFHGGGVPFARGAWGALERDQTGTEKLLLVGQRFAGPADVVSPISERSVVRPAEVGTLTVDDVDDAGLPVYTRSVAPIRTRVTPLGAHIGHSGDEVSGTLEVELDPTMFSALRVALDLPFGWRGTLAGEGFDREVYDLGWPWFEAFDITSPTLTFDWSARPADTLSGGDYLVQLRVEATLGGGGEFTMRTPARVEALPRGTPELVFTRADFHRRFSRLYRLHFPDGWRAEPGDVAVLDTRISEPDPDLPTSFTLRLHPAGSIPNDRGAADDVLPLLPLDGYFPGVAPPGRGEASVVFPIGWFHSWLGHPRMAQLMADARFEPTELRLYRRPVVTGIEGWSRRVPYIEAPPGSFHLPRYHALLAEGDLRRAMRIVSGAPHEVLFPDLRRADYLDNIEAGPMGWRVSESARRDGFLRSSYSVVFRGEHIGARVAIHDERIAGQRFFGVEFGYGPFCGTVGVRDCEGRLVAVQDLYLNEDRAVPHWTWVALPYPSRDPWIYLEVMGIPPGSHAAHIPLQKFMIVDNIDGE